MSEARRQFEIVKDDPPDNDLATSALLLGLKALSQRAIAAIMDLFMLLTVASVWWLWASIPNPSPTQIVALALYATFVLVANWIVRTIR